MRFDPGSGPIRMETVLTGSFCRGQVADEYRKIRLEEVTSVLWRWPTPPVGHPDIESADRRTWAAREDTLALYGVLKTLPVRWVNHPDRASRAGVKPAQLITAVRCGLTVPDTIVTTSGGHARTWGRDRDVLYKAFMSQGSNDNGMVPASRADLPGLPADLGAASMFQEVIEGTPVRVTLIGDSVFAVEISGTDDLDWRPVQNLLTFIPIDVPPDVVVAMHEFMRRFGLEYGAFDFIVSRTRWVFLECNPKGMYGFVEIQSGLEITAAIADRLSRPAGSAGRRDRSMGR
jgi:glutathione synthase/RimK-type ligase-like ATP-grasp enzyme